MTTTPLAVRPTPVMPIPGGMAAIRVSRPPMLEPPTDDERNATGYEAPSVTAVALPLDLPTLPGPTGSRPGRHPRAPARSGQLVSRGRADPLGPAAARLAVHRFVGACLEVIGGYRPLTHLRPLCLPDRYAAVAEHLGGRKGSGQRNRGAVQPATRTPVVGWSAAGAPPRTARYHHPTPGDRIGVLRVHMSQPRDGAAELAVVLCRRDHIWAMAIRLEVRGGRWLCTHLDVL